MGGTTSGKGPISRRWTTGLLAAGLIAVGSVRAGDVTRLSPPARVRPAVTVVAYDLDSLRAPRPRPQPRDRGGEGEPGVGRRRPAGGR